MLLKEEEEKDEAIGSEGGDTKRNPNLHLTVNPDIYCVKKRHAQRKTYKGILLGSPVYLL